MHRQVNHTTLYESEYYTFQYTKDKDDNPPEDSNLTSFDEDNSSKH